MYRRTAAARGPSHREGDARRGGNIMIISAAFLTTGLGLTALGIDLGFIAMARAQLHAAADAAALAAVLELKRNFGIYAEQDADPLGSARSAATTQAGLHQVASNPVEADEDDVRFGRYTWPEGAGGWERQWQEDGTEAPFNMARVTLRHTVSLFFGPVLGSTMSTVEVTSVAAAPPGGFREVNGGIGDILPIGYDEPSWEEMIASGQTRIRLFPYTNQELASGNYGLLRFGEEPLNNLVRQIRDGLSSDDLAYPIDFGGELSLSDGPFDLGGRQGNITANDFRNALNDIIGQPRAVALFSMPVSGQGNTAVYEIVRFIGLTIVEVNLTGNPNDPEYGLWADISPLPNRPARDSAIVADGIPVDSDSLLASIRLIE